MIFIVCVYENKNPIFSKNSWWAKSSTTAVLLERIFRDGFYDAVEIVKKISRILTNFIQSL